MFHLIPFIMAYFALIAHHPIAVTIIIVVGILLNISLIRDMLKRNRCD